MKMYGLMWRGRMTAEAARLGYGESALAGAAAGHPVSSRSDKEVLAMRRYLALCLVQVSLGPHSEHGSFVLWVKRGDKGAWQIAVDTWNDSGHLGFVPAAQPSAP